MAAYYEIQRLYPNEVDKFQTLPITYKEKMPNGLIVSATYPGAKEILQKFNKGLEIIKQSGEYDRIISKYHMGTID